jgi:hypothetical protein
MFKLLPLFVALFVATNGQLRGLQNLNGLQGLRVIDGSQLAGLQGLQGLNGGNGQIVLLLSNQGQTAPVSSQVISLAQPQAPPSIVLRSRPAPPSSVRIETTTTDFSSSRSRFPSSRDEVSSSDDGSSGAPMPYSFEYSTDDEQGTRTSRQESSDGNRVTGSYSYVDADGLERIVDYVADENGYRPTIRTNEPGVGRNEEIGDPADTKWDISAPPAAVTERWLNFQAVQSPPQRTNIQVRPAPPTNIRIVAQEPPRQNIQIVRQPPTTSTITLQQQAPQNRFVLVPADQLGSLGLGNLNLNNLQGLGSSRVVLLNKRK